MSEPLFIKNSITINSGASRVWNALTNPEQTKKYMFGCEALSDWKVGSPLIWKGVFNGAELVAVKGTIVNITPEKLLEYTTIDPNSGVDDVPGNYLNVTYGLSEEGGQTVLTVTQGDYSKVGNGAKRYAEAVEGGGWSSILTEIKKIVEAE